MVDNGSLSADAVINAALSYMSEDDTREEALELEEVFWAEYQRWGICAYIVAG